MQGRAVEKLGKLAWASWHGRGKGGRRAGARPSSEGQSDAAVPGGSRPSRRPHPSRGRRPRSPRTAPAGPCGPKECGSAALLSSRCARAARCRWAERAGSAPRTARLVIQLLQPACSPAPSPHRLASVVALQVEPLPSPPARAGPAAHSPEQVGQRGSHQVQLRQRQRRGPQVERSKGGRHGAAVERGRGGGG